MNDRGPASGNGMKQKEEGGDRAGKIEKELHDVGPNHGFHAALERVDEHERHDQQDRGALLGAKRGLDDETDGGDAHAFGQDARDQKRARGDTLYLCAKPPFHQLIGRIIFSPEVAGQKNQYDHHAAHEVSENQLKERQVSRESQCRSADDGERGSFRGDNRKRQCPPGRRAAAQKIVANRALASAKRNAERGDAGQVNGDQDKVERGQAHSAGVAII